MQSALLCVGLYYGITIIIVSLATAMTVLTLNIHHRGEHGAPVPRLIQKICFDRLLSRLLCLRPFNADEQHIEQAVGACLISRVLFTPTYISSHYIKVI